jgi:mannose/fructose-specific phosphotransferase system component IIA
VNNNVTNYFVTPVPATNMVTLMLDTKEATANAQLILTDMNGRTVMNQSLNIAKGMNAFNVPVANLPAGLYLLNVAGNNIKLSQKITVAH